MSDQDSEKPLIVLDKDCVYSVGQVSSMPPDLKDKFDKCHINGNENIYIHGESIPPCNTDYPISKTPLFFKKGIEIKSRFQTAEELDTIV